MNLQDRGTKNVRPAMKWQNNVESCSTENHKCVRLVTVTTDGKARDSLEKKLANVVATREAQFEATQSSLFVEESLREPNVGNGHGQI